MAATGGSSPPRPSRHQIFWRKALFASTTAAPSWAIAAFHRTAGGLPSTGPRHTAGAAAHRARYQRAWTQAWRGPASATSAPVGIPDSLRGARCLLSACAKLGRPGPQ
ncbi:hypothetical protein NDU88_003604 [Pleurodeles waltl]|uniref:Uncharacterized protein n=1 Tax=Pleurodeles waltl TaxID=8319 RepID=A0AAV7LHI3_PLEWA|nr:hypothetical protein NDU88_003604 [Pleurodeles waltl]